MKKLFLIAFLALALPLSAFAGNPHHKKHHKHHQKPPIVVPVPTPEPVQVSAVSYCAFATNNQGVDTYVYVQASPGSFLPGGDWRALYDANSKVLIAGNYFTFKNVGDAGIYLAPTVNGVSLCP